MVQQLQLIPSGLSVMLEVEGMAKDQVMLGTYIIKQLCVLPKYAMTSGNHNTVLKTPVACAITCLASNSIRKHHPFRIPMIVCWHLTCM